MVNVLQKQPAILIFAYCRADLLEKVLSNLSKANNLINFNIYVHIDFPQTESLFESSLEVSEVIEKYSEIIRFTKIVRQDKHLGLRKSVISFLLEIAKLHDYLIILEDDILISRDFLDFQLKCLLAFENNSSVGSISGYRMDKFLTIRKRDILLSRRHSSWGWGTWASLINEIDWNVLDHPSELSRVKRKVSRAGKDLVRMVEMYQNDKIDSWSIIFDVNMVLLNKMAIHPRHQKIQNIGFSSGTHFDGSTELTKSMREDLNEISENIITTKVYKGRFYDQLIKFKANQRFLSNVLQFRNCFKQWIGRV